MRSVSWPVQGDRETFRQRLLVGCVAGGTVLSAAVALAVVINPALLRPLVPLVASVALLLLLWCHGTARTAARRREVERSFAGLVVLHQGRAFEVAQQPLLGRFGTRRLAARAALDRGGWAIIVHAWDSYFLLACAPTSDATPAGVPVSFRSRAVADVVPAIDETVAIA